jgi:hypothetical protein
VASAQWTKQQSAEKHRDEVRRLVADESDERVKIWARIRLGGERGVDVAREYDYRDGAGVAQVVGRLEKQTQADRTLRRKLAGLRQKVSG